MKKTRALLSGRIVEDETKETVVISSKCPLKWVCIDLEKGSAYVLENDHYRNINSVEKKEVLKILRKRNT